MWLQGSNLDELCDVAPHLFVPVVEVAGINSSAGLSANSFTRSFKDSTPFGCFLRLNSSGCPETNLLSYLGGELGRGQIVIRLLWLRALHVPDT
jgi:hypothetical protein